MAIKKPTPKPKKQNRSLASSKQKDKVKRKPYPSRLSEKIRSIRMRHDLTQATMLLIINPEENEQNRARVSQYESGQRVPSLIEVMNYARFAGVTMETLVNDKLDLPEKYKNF